MAMKYIIGSGSLPGIPARDLTDEEVLKFGRVFLLKTGLYQEDSQKNVIIKNDKKEKTL